MASICWKSMYGKGGRNGGQGRSDGDILQGKQGFTSGSFCKAWLES